MKVDFLRKAKWYIVGFILIAVMLSVSLSFSAWDSLSFKAIMNANGGDFTEKPYELGELEGDDANKNGIAEVGDIVTFGNYYQTASINENSKTPIRWIVVDITDRLDGQGKQLTLLAEKVMAFGSFWGTYYYNTSGGWVPGVNNYRYQNYSESTVRAWLNSGVDILDKPIVRTDGGPVISSGSTQGVQFKGFITEAFSPDEREYILPKTISGMKGAGMQSATIKDYDKVADKVWLPSYSEVFGNSTVNWKNCSDGLPNGQFSYFANDSNTKVGKSTEFAATPSMSNYTLTGLSHQGNSQSLIKDSPVWWWFRSPHPSNWYDALNVYGIDTGTYCSYGGVRPAVCVPL